MKDKIDLAAELIAGNTKVIKDLLETLIEIDWIALDDVGNPYYTSCGLPIADNVKLVFKD